MEPADVGRGGAGRSRAAPSCRRSGARRPGTSRSAGRTACARARTRSTRSSWRCIAPTALARMQLRSHSIDELKMAMPAARLPEQLRPRDRRSPSRTTSLIGDVRRPIFSSGCPIEQAGRVALDEERAQTPRSRCVRSVVANTTNTSAIGRVRDERLRPVEDRSPSPSRSRGRRQRRRRRSRSRARSSPCAPISEPSQSRGR